MGGGFFSSLGRDGARFGCTRWMIYCKEEMREVTDFGRVGCTIWYGRFGAAVRVQSVDRESVFVLLCV